MGIDKKRLLEVESLNLSSKLSGMSDSEYNNYCTALEAFVENFPALEAELKRLYKADDLDDFGNKLSVLEKTLLLIRADGLMRICGKLPAKLKETNRDMAEAYLTYFLTSVSMLSIEIQMARHKVEEEIPKAIVLPPPKAQVVIRQKSILAVDDVSVLLSTLRNILAETDYKFTGVTSGESALKFVKDHEVDLFLLDIEMPEMDGYQLAVKLKQRGHYAPIIFLTGNAKKEYVVRAMQVGAADFIIKPIDRDHVLDKINKFIK